MALKTKVNRRRPEPADKGPPTGLAKAQPAKESGNVIFTAASVVPKAWTISGIAGVNSAIETGPIATSSAPISETRRSVITGAGGVVDCMLMRRSFPGGGLWG